MRVSIWMRSLCVCAALSAAPALMAQDWEAGVLGGGGFYLNNGVTGSRGTGEAGHKPGLAAGGWIGHNSAGRLGGEIRYQFQKNDMKVASGGSTYTFAGMAHSVTYDLLVHTRPREDRVRPYFAVGGGIKGYRGTGKEVAFQPLSNIAIPTATQQWMPLLTFGAGAKWTLGERMVVRIDVRDYVTQFPKDVILPSPGNKIGGWVHSIVPTAGISYMF